MVYGAQLINASFFRLASLLVTAGAVFALPDKEIFRNLVYSFGYAHYILAVFYSQKQVRSAAGRPDMLLPAIGVLAAGVSAFFFAGSFLPVLFTVHVALEEAYLSSKNPRFPSGALSILLISLYLFLFRRSDALGWIDPRLLLIMAAGAGVFFCVRLYQARASLGAQELMDRSVPALVTGAAAGISLFYPVTFIQIALYHFAFWILYPSAKMPGLKFPALMAGAVGIAFFFSPLGFFPAPMDSSLFRQGFLLLSYLHIAYSFMLSESQPVWLTRLFRPSLKTQGAAVNL